MLVADQDAERRPKKNMVLPLLHVGLPALRLSCNVTEGDSRNQVVYLHLVHELVKTSKLVQ